MGVAGALVLAAEARAVAVFVPTRGRVSDGRPKARAQGPHPFFAAAAIAANAILLMIIVLDGSPRSCDVACRQA